MAACSLIGPVTPLLQFLMVRGCVVLIPFPPALRVNYCVPYTYNRLLWTSGPRFYGTAKGLAPATTTTSQTGEKQNQKNLNPFFLLDSCGDFFFFTVLCFMRNPIGLIDPAMGNTLTEYMNIAYTILYYYYTHAGDVFFNHLNLFAGQR